MIQQKGHCPNLSLHRLFSPSLRNQDLGDVTCRAVQDRASAAGGITCSGWAVATTLGHPELRPWQYVQLHFSSACFSHSAASTCFKHQQHSSFRSPQLSVSGVSITTGSFHASFDNLRQATRQPKRQCSHLHCIDVDCITQPAFSAGSAQERH